MVSQFTVHRDIPALMVGYYLEGFWVVSEWRVSTIVEQRVLS